MTTTQSTEVPPLLPLLYGDTTHIGKTKSDLLAQGRKIESADSQERAMDLLSTGKISCIIFSLNLSDLANAAIIQNIRAARPKIRVIILGDRAEDERSYRDIIKQEFLYIAKSVDASVSYVALNKAIDDEYAKIKHRSLMFFWLQFALAVFGLSVIFLLAEISGSPVGKFFGTFWIFILAVEFSYYLRHVWRKTCRN